MSEAVTRNLKPSSFFFNLSQWEHPFTPKLIHYTISDPEFTFRDTSIKVITETDFHFPKFSYLKRSVKEDIAQQTWVWYLKTITTLICLQLCLIYKMTNGVVHRTHACNIPKCFLNEFHKHKEQFASPLTIPPQTTPCVVLNHVIIPLDNFMLNVCEKV